MANNESSPRYYWFHSRPHRFLFVVVGFGLGPRIAAENLLVELNLGSDIEVNWRSEDLISIPESLDISLFFNFGVLVEIPDLKPKFRVWIDCVDWLRTTLPEHIQEYDLLLREAFFVSEESKNKGDVSKWHDVQPLLNDMERFPCTDSELILISFGGVNTPYSNDIHTKYMPFAFLRGVNKFISKESSKRVIAYLPENLYSTCLDIKEKWHKNLEFRKLDRLGFSHEMKRCSMLICQAGLYTPFEALKFGVPFILAYPMSFTQLKQITKFKELGITCCPSPYEDFQTDDFLANKDIEVIEKIWFENTTKSWKKKSQSGVEEQVYSFLLKATQNVFPYNLSCKHLHKLKSASEVIRHEIDK